MPDKHLGVVPVLQETDWYCGPACAQMVLTFLGVAPPAGAGSWQDKIRVYIESHTNATRPSLADAPESEFNPAFNEQKCELCGGEYECWATTPNVLKNLLNANQSTVTYEVARTTTEYGATDAALDTIDKGHPAIALVEGWQHFVVVDGYRHDEAGSVTTYSRKLNGVWYCDPLDDSAVQYKPIDEWVGSYLYWVPCGTYEEEILAIREKKQKKAKKAKRKR
jgi:hypothetical protein